MHRGDLVAELIPGIRSAPIRVIRLHPEHLERVAPDRRARGVGHGRAGEKQPGAVAHEPALLDIAAHPDDVLRPAGHAGRDRGHLTAVVCRVARGLGRRVVRGEGGHALVVGVDRVQEVLPPGVERRHRDEVLDVDGREHRLAGQVHVAVLGLDAGAPPRVEHQAGDPAVAQHLSSPPLDHLDQRPDQFTGAALRDRPAAPLSSEHDRVGERAGAGGVDGLPGLERHPEHERLDVATLELMAHDLPGAHRGAPQPACGSRESGQHRLERRAQADRGEPVRREHVLDRVVLAEQPAVGGGIRAREPLELLARPLEIEPHGQRLAVREHHVGHRVGLQVTQPVLALQAELVAGQHRVGLDQGVPGGAGVEPIAGQQELLAGHAATRDTSRVEHPAAVARPGEVGGGDQAVVTSAGDDDVGVDGSAHGAGEAGWVGA